jgi:hyperosmotically inducible periplasmic protein
MKKTVRKILFSLTLVIASSMLFISCKVKDSDIQSSVIAKTKDLADAANISINVKDGIVTLAGQCKDEAAKAAWEPALKGLKGVKQIINNITVTPPPPPPAPVIIAADDPLTKGVSDALKDFPAVKADVKDGIITLTGEANKADLKRIMSSLNTLKPKKINNQLIIK